MRSNTGGGVLDVLHHLVLPALAIGLASVGTVARFTRSSMLEAISQDYVRTARAKGLAEPTVHLRHTLKNALIPVMTIVGLQLGYLLGGAVLTEVIFAWPGLGRLMLEAILARDFPVIQGSVLLIALVFVLVNLAVDLLYAYVDPRIRYQ
jgi:peptide/nickel transport system permease protein